MSNVLKIAGAGVSAAAVPSDADFENTVLLLHGDGTNGAQNNTFLDSSTNNFTITRNGNTTQGTFSPFSKPDGAWGNYFDGTDDYLIVADNAVLRPGAGAFTLEAWIYRAASGAAHTIYAKGGASTGINFQVTSGNVLRFTHTTTNIDSSGTVAANAWVHVAVVREGTGTNQTKLYINGTQDGQGTVSTDFTQTEQVRIGTDRSAGDDFNGYISNLRFVKGSALYTGNFTPSTSPFTTTSQGASSSEVELLTCQSNRFLDNSTNAFAVTISGGPRVTPFSPFPITTAYDPAVNGGAGYFDGDGDYLVAGTGSAGSPGTGDFCAEAWVYPQNSTEMYIITNLVSSGAGDTQWGIAMNTGSNFISFTGWFTVYLTTAAPPLNAWCHVAVCRSGTTLSLFVNGTRAATATNSQNFSSTNNIRIGAAASGTSPLLGYISSARFVKGSSVYDPSQTTLTVPTSPLTAISNTSLLCNFTNAGIFDNTGFNALETVGDAQIDTSVKKYGTGSMEFDGTGDRLVFPPSPDVAFGTGDFTIEFWMNSNNVGGDSQRGFFQTSDTAGGLKTTYTSGVVVGQGLSGSATPLTGGIWANVIGNIIGSSTPVVTTSVWYHIALVRNSGTVTLYVNGVSNGSASVTGSIDGQNLVVGGYFNTSYLFNGYIDDFRITKGIARYTAAFTPPTAAFPDIGV
jgi:hypothetical protein